MALQPGQLGSKKERSRLVQVGQRGASTGGWDRGWGRGAVVQSSSMMRGGGESVQGAGHMMLTRRLVSLIS